MTTNSSKQSTIRLTGDASEKSSYCMLLLVLFCTKLFSQSIEGDWSGQLNAGLSSIRLEFVFNLDGSLFQAFLTSPDQDNFVLQSNRAKINGKEIKLEFSSPVITYVGNWDGNAKISGVFKQSGMEFPLILNRGKMDVLRPQHPKKPFPYLVENIVFRSTKDSTKLAGELAVPKGKRKNPVVILISGSGPHNRDGEAYGHRTLFVLSDYLARKNFSVLRYDERGTGKSEGSYTKAGMKVHISDIEAAIDYLTGIKKVEIGRIGLIGHSLGANLAMEIARKNNDLGFVVFLGGSTIPGKELMLLQKATIEEKLGVNPIQIAIGQKIFETAYDVISKSETNNHELNKKLIDLFEEKYTGTVSSPQIKLIVKNILTPVIYDFIRYDPKIALPDIKAHILGIYGSHDVQVPAKANSNALLEALEDSQSKSYMVHTVPGVNHMLQNSTTGLPNEYSKISNTVSTELMLKLVLWLESIYR